MSRSLRFQVSTLVAAAAAFSSVVGGCASGTASQPDPASPSLSGGAPSTPPLTAPAPAIDPDGDGTRATARRADANVALTGSVDPDKGDLVDFYAFQLGGPVGPFTVELHWDDESAELGLEVFSGLGERIAQPRGQFEGPQRRVIAEIPDAGTYYVKISSVKGASDYTFRGKWAGGSGAGAPAASASPPTSGDAATTTSGEHASARTDVAPPEDEMHPRCKIIQSYRDDDGQLVLYIDRGTAANVKPGMTGAILDGADGDRLLAGGTFRVTKVIDSGKSVGKASLVKTGSNRRCVIYLIK